MSKGWKRGLRWAGSALAVAGIVFVLLRLREYGGEIDTSRFTAAFWVALTALAAVYGLANLLLVSAWQSLLGHFGAATSGRWALVVYGTSQLAKYLPGNVFHLAGRQALAMAEGIAAWPVAKSAIWELGLLALAGGVFGVLVLPALWPGVTQGMALAGFVLAGAAVGYLMRRYLGKPVARALVLYLGFLAVSGLIFVAVLELVAAGGSQGQAVYVLICGAFVVAWLAGLVTPGAPAGAGVRELVVIALLNGIVEPGDLVVATVLSRIVTVLGDVMLFVTASLARKSVTA